MQAARVKNGFAVPVADDMGDGPTTCRNHPYRNNLGGICAFCLQEKLGKLVSSSSSSFPVLDSPSSSSSPSSPASFASASSAAHGSSLTKTPFSGSSGANPSSRSLIAVDADDSGSRRARIPFLLARGSNKKKKLQPETVLKRSKSGAGPRAGTGRHFLEDESDYSPGTRRTGGGFWSFLHLSASSSSSSKSSASRKGEKTLSSFEEENPAVNGNGDRFPSFERKVSRSRSVGCGSRSFSGDFFDRISTGLGDCTLRRVVSHREVHNSDRNLKQAQRIYKCGGIFGGFTMIAAAPSPSPSYWVSSATQGGDHHNHHHLQVPGKSSALANGSHSRIRIWNWAFPSPMRAFAKPIKERKREINIIRNGSGRNSAPNLSAVPSLLAVGG